MKTLALMNRACGRRLSATLVVAAFLGLAWTGHTAWADVTSGGGASIIRVEEDWCLLVSAPDSSTCSPQVSTQMARAPYASRFSNLHINSCDVPTFRQGGLQLQVWQGTVNQAALSIQSGVMNSSNELVTWTQYLRVDGTSLKFGVSAASSTTWGDFSGQEVIASGRSIDLSAYSVDYSVNNSGVTYGANRVTAMVLTGVRTYYSDGSMQTDATPRVIYSTLLDQTLGGN